MGTESRKLSAVLFADMVGFSALRQALALELREELLALVSLGIAPHRGRVVNVMGDGFFAEFPTALDAVQFALSLQRAVVARNHGPRAGATGRLRLRIGIHVGEVVIQGDNILGSTVNIAARTEKLAAPGGVCMTAQVWEQVKEELPERARGLGKIHVRNIHQRLSFYHVDPPEVGPAFWLLHWLRTSGLGLGRRGLAFLVGCLVILAGLLAWQSLRPRLPPTPDQRYQHDRQLLEFYDQKENLTNALQDLRELARTVPDRSEIHGALGWAFWLAYEQDEREGTRQDALSAASKSCGINSNSVNGQMVIGLVERDLLKFPEAAAYLRRANDLERSANGLVLIFLAYVVRAGGDERGAEELVKLAEQSAGNRWLVFDRIGIYYYRTEPHSQNLEHALASFQRAVQCEPDSPLAHLHLGQLLLARRETAAGRKELETALGLNRTAVALSAMGSFYFANHNWDEAAKYFGEASQADPSKYIYHINLGRTLWEATQRFTIEPEKQRLGREELEQALRQLDGVLSLGEKPLARAYRGLCEAFLGRVTEARTDLERADQENPDDHSILVILRDGYLALRDLNTVREIGERLNK